jgi:hypothetical protein
VTDAGEVEGNPNLGFYIGIAAALIVLAVGAVVWIHVHGV